MKNTTTLCVVYFEIVLPNTNNFHLSHSRSVGDKSESAVRTSWAIFGGLG